MSQVRSGANPMRPGAPPGGGPGFFGGRGPMMTGMPMEKPKDFRGTLIRMLRYFVPENFRLIVVFLAAILSTAFSIVAPKIMGLATTRLFDGVVAKMRGVPGAHVDFGYIRTILIWLVTIYVISAAFGYAQQYIMAGVAQRTVYRMRRDVDEKFARLPLSFFDARTHGEIMSRAVNDMDNISSTLQQSLTQLIIAIVTVAGIIIMLPWSC
jgi:ATP-binding cassette subfamily B protein